ncbi:MAG: aminotransferase class III-fold pyridoxal phosphate-dependent enzyme [Balneolaceae bacterium]|nr:aminotransferase class III-fold pyridoxal phosphate-dependent enzyme [Balneolaceae bacterium]
MNVFNVYPLLDVEPVKGKGNYVYDQEGTEYLDFYGGHAVISIGHSHPHYVNRLNQQLSKLGFYSNSVPISIQQELAGKLTQLSGYNDWKLFMCNSGAEANENALKVASSWNRRKKVVAFKGAFHGRTSLAVAATDNPSIVFPVNEGAEVTHVDWQDIKATELLLKEEDVCAVIIEGIQGVGGIRIPNALFLKQLRELCAQTGTALILDEVQSGFGRTGKFFAHQHFGIEPDIITMAKGMGNGFPVGAVLIHPRFEASYGMLGTTFGGNHLACAASLAVVEVINHNGLMGRATKFGAFLLSQLKGLPGSKEIRGLGLMIGLEFNHPVAELRKELLYKHHIFTGSSSNKNVLRLLPPLSAGRKECDQLIEALQEVCQ